MHLCRVKFRTSFILPMPVSPSCCCRMIHVKPYLIQGFLELFVATQAPPHLTPLEVRKPAFPHGIKDVVAVWRKQRTGTFATCKPELRTSGDISQWTDRYWIVVGRSQSPRDAKNFTIAISTRSQDSSEHVSTLMVPEKVHAVPFTRKF